MKVEVIQLTDYNSPYFDKICEWNYKWWWKDEWYSYEQLREHFKYSLNTKEQLPQTFIATSNNELVWMYRINPYGWTIVRPDIYPILSTVYVDKKHRWKWIWTQLMQHAIQTIKKLKIKKIYLYTNIKWFYEKFWWKYIWNINTLEKEEPVSRLYMLENN